MSLRLRLKNASTLAVTRLREEFRRLRARLNTREGSNFVAILQELYLAAWNTLHKAGKPSFDPSFLRRDTDPDPIAWNRNMEQVETDLRSLYAEDAEIKRLRAEVKNTSVVLAKEIEGRNNLAASMITDLRLISGQLDQDVIVAGDDFSNMEKIDGSFPLTYPMADVNVLQGVVTLKRLEAVNVVDPGTVKIAVTPLSPAPATNRAPTPDNTSRFYEGKFYSPIGEARPEGGRWHLEERVRPGTVISGNSDTFIIDEGNEKKLGNIFTQFPDLRNPGDARPEGFPLSPEDILVIDRGASLEELLSVRKRMVDGNPDSFWECEYVLSTDKLNDLANKLLDPESASSGGGDPSGTQVAQVTPEDLRARAAQSDIDTADFEVEIILELPRSETCNFITVNPMNFGETAWLEITDVSTASDLDEEFALVDGFGNFAFDNTLTDEANAELTDGKLSVTLAPNRYSFRGLGVFTFSPREVAKIRIRLMQRVPIPSQYERTVVQLNRTLTSTSSSVKQSGGM